ncbi:hypothetical protein [Pseudofulvimonas gallinarii]|jgi:hypothetical protein|uniref:Uncharacterized protein n=2 Tax=Pseudofulvimonas gallinarii TaxID=634155 RepID=A0A4S3KW85_9GAMM|nr:hypothetical protein [Pseudofulvimonas gallinarii]TCT00081.1 hypothetical protein EDC25_10471 [Pseudofulvimonas gallinarii]THD13555.1 hypothetical protein B1808_07365 [Pseudofulvimonas gallinarii]
MWPFWTVLVLFEACLWLLLSLKFRQPCCVVALAAGLTLGVAVQILGGRRWRGALWAVGLTALTIALALYGQAAFHIARVLHLSPLASLADTGVQFASLVLEGLLSPVDGWLLLGGLLVAAVMGFGIHLPRRRGAATP